MNIVRRFTRVNENFVCENCGTEVSGTGYTNHCPECLTSKHVDIFPGDRLEDCGGLMDLVDITQKGDSYQLTFTCRVCSATSKDHYREGIDNFDTLLKHMENINKNK